MTTTNDRPAVICPSWCADHSEPDPGTSVHSTPVVSLPGDDPEDRPTLDGMSRVWAVSTDDDVAPDFFVHISREGATAAEVRETARQLMAFADQVDTTAIDALEKAGNALEEHFQQSKPTVIPPCPPWCIEPAGHDYEGLGGHPLAPERTHVAYTSEVASEALECNRDGVVTLHEPMLCASFQDTFSAEEALPAAAQVLEAARVLKGLQQ